MTRKAIADVAEDQRVLRPADHRARAHHGRDVAVDEALARQFGDLDHLLDDRLAAGIVIFARLGEHDLRLDRGRQIIERRDDVPAVHLALIDRLGAVIEAGRVAEPDRVGRREQPEPGIRADHAVLVEQGQLALGLQHALDHEHHVRPAGIIFVEHQRDRMLQRPGQQPFAELGHLLAVAQHDRVAADEVDAADMRIEVDPDQRPVQPRRDLLDMGRLAGAVIALDHHPAVLREAGADRQRRVRDRRHRPGRGRERARRPR